KLAETKLAQAVQLRKSDFAEATRSAEESYRLAWEATEAFAPSMRGFLDVVPARVNEWADATLTVENEGKGAAKDVRVRILGDARPCVQGAHQERIQGHPLRLRPGLPRAVRLPRRPVPGLLPVHPGRLGVIRRGGPRPSPLPRGTARWPTTPGCCSHRPRGSGPRRAAGPRTVRTRGRR